MPMKILVCGPSWVGDMVMAQSLFISLKHQYPEALIDVLAPPWSTPLLARMPEIRQAIELPVAHGEMGIRKRFQAGRRLAGEGYGWAIITPRSIKPALVPFFARIPQRTGYKGQARYIFINDAREMDKSKLTMTVQRQLYLGLPKNAPQPPDSIPYPSLQINNANRHRAAEGLHLDLSRPVVCFFPGAEFGPSKQWPLSYFRTLAETLAAAGYQVWIMGGPQDRSYGAEITGEGIPHVHDLIGKTSLEDAIDLISLARIAVTNDSGLMHVAAAVGVHVEALYGATTPAFTPPLTDQKSIHYLGLECSPCFERECPHGHLQCLTRILPEQVMQSIDRAFSRQ